MGHETQIGSRWSMGSMEHMLGRRQPQDLKGAKDKRQNTKKNTKDKKEISRGRGCIYCSWHMVAVAQFQGIAQRVSPELHFHHV